MIGESFNAAYEDYAIYLPSLQQQYARLPLADPATIRNAQLPGALELGDLNYLNPDSKLWHCKYALYSAGQFSSSRIMQPDIISTRDRNATVVLGDSGGFQIGKGTLNATADWGKDANKPDLIFKRWIKQPAIRERMLRWLDMYSDYAMTLDMPLWALNDKASPFRKLSAQQLIDLSVENLRFFDKHGGKQTGSKAKYLNVLQDVGDGTGDAWYKAVTQFDFTSGWALGSATGGSINRILYWVRRLLDDKLLDDCEWIHILGVSSPAMAVYLTALQRALRKATGNEKLRVSYDSSSPFQHAGKHKLVAQVPTLTSDIKSWSIPTFSFPQNPKYLSSTQKTYLLQALSPATQRVSIEEFLTTKGNMSRNLFDKFSEQLLINHNMYVYHRTAVDACDLVFDGSKDNSSRVPEQVKANLSLIESTFTT
jgi:hypothetical protein